MSFVVVFNQVYSIKHVFLPVGLGRKLAYHITGVSEDEERESETEKSYS